MTPLIGKVVSSLTRHSDGHSGVPPEEWLVVALLLSAVGGYLDAFTVLLHDGVLATTQSANVVLLGVHAATGDWARASGHLPPIFAFVVGVFVAHHQRMHAPDRSRRLSLVLELIILLLVLRTHVHLPKTAGTVGIAFAAAVQNTCFTRVEGWAYSSVMTTRNLQQAAEGLLTGVAGSGNPTALRQSRIFASLCLAFSLGAACGAVTTTQIGAAALAIPIALVLVALTICEVGRWQQTART